MPGYGSEVMKKNNFDENQLNLFDEKFDEKGKKSGEKEEKNFTAPLAKTGSQAEKNFTVYTDGSCLKNPDGPGGWAAIILDETGNKTELKGGAPSTTNNRMELTAALAALTHTSPGAKVCLYTDSQYLRHAFTEHWLRKWQRNGWRTSGGGDVKNKDLWVELYAAFADRQVEFRWVKGHAGNEFNERCDFLARSEAAKLQK